MAQGPSGAGQRGIGGFGGGGPPAAGSPSPAPPDGAAALPGAGLSAEAPPLPPGEFAALAQQVVPSPATYPYSAVVLVLATFPNGVVFGGSGVMVGRNDVLTAGHLVYQPAWGGVAASVTVSPAYTPETGFFGGPYGASYASVLADTGFDPDGDGFVAPGDRGPGLAGSERDVAFLSLQWPLGDRTGWMGVDPTFAEGYANLSGYPGRHGGRLTNDTAYAFIDPVDSFIHIGWFEAWPGNSGGPLWHYGADGRPAVVGIASSGTIDGRGGAAFDVANSHGSIPGWIASNDHLIA